MTAVTACPWLAFGGLGHPNTIIVSLFLVGLYTGYRFLVGSSGEGWRRRRHAIGVGGGSLALGMLLGGVFLAPFAMARISDRRELRPPGPLVLPVCRRRGGLEILTFLRRPNRLGECPGTPPSQSLAAR